MRRKMQEELLEVKTLLIELHGEELAILKQLEEKTDALSKAVSNLEILDGVSDGIQNIMSYEVKR